MGIRVILVLILLLSCKAWAGFCHDLRENIADNTVRLRRAVGFSASEDTPRLMLADLHDEVGDSRFAAYIRTAIDFATRKKFAPGERVKMRNLLTRFEESKREEIQKDAPEGVTWEWSRGFIGKVTVDMTRERLEDKAWLENLFTFLKRFGFVAEIEITGYGQRLTDPEYQMPQAESFAKSLLDLINVSGNQSAVKLFHKTCDTLPRQTDARLISEVEIAHENNTAMIELLRSYYNGPEDAFLTDRKKGDHAEYLHFLNRVASGELREQIDYNETALYRHLVRHAHLVPKLIEEKILGPSDFKQFATGEHIDLQPLYRRANDGDPHAIFFVTELVKAVQHEVKQPVTAETGNDRLSDFIALARMEQGLKKKPGEFQLPADLANVFGPEGAKLPPNLALRDIQHLLVGRAAEDLMALSPHLEPLLRQFELDADIQREIAIPSKTIKYSGYHLIRGLAGPVNFATYQALFHAPFLKEYGFEKLIPRLADNWARSMQIPGNERYLADSTTVMQSTLPKSLQYQVTAQALARVAFTRGSDRQNLTVHTLARLAREGHSFAKQALRELQQDPAWATVSDSAKRKALDAAR